jgi:hypothetical protein
VVVVVILGALAVAGVFSPKTSNTSSGGSTSPSGAKTVYSGTTTLQPSWSTPEGGFQWGWGGAIQRSNPTVTTIAWTASYPASVCLVYTGTQSTSYNYSQCRGATYSSTSGQMTSGVWSVSIPPNANYNESGYYVWYTFVEPSLPPVQTDHPMGQIWTNNSSSFLVGTGPGRLATVQSSSLNQTWTTPTISLPTPQTEFTAYANFSGSPLTLSVSTNIRATCFLQSSDAWVCQGSYATPTSLTLTLNYNTTADLPLTIQVIVWS